MPSSTPGPQFDYDEVGHHYYPVSSVLTTLQSMSSASSAHSRHDEGLPHDEPQSSNSIPIASPPEARRDENLDTPGPSRAILTLKRWIPTRIRKSNPESALHELNRVPRESDHPPDSQPPSQLPATNQGPSWMAAGKRKRVSGLY